jgi:hypothetical protein
MRSEHKEGWQLIKAAAFDYIQKNGDSWRDWCHAKTDEDRELLIVEAVWHMGFEQGCKTVMGGGGYAERIH